MEHERCIEVLTGEAAWLKYLRKILFVLTLLALASANTYWTFKILTIALFLWLSLKFFKQIRQQTPILALQFDTSGIASLFTNSETEIRAVLDSRAWTSRWFCVLTLIPLNQLPSRKLLVCRSNNQFDSYRRLLIYLRLGADSRSTDGILMR